MNQPMQSSGYGRNPFTGMPVEYFIPKNAKVIFVADFFTSEVSGGAELTSEAILKKSPYKVARIHSSSVTRRLLEENKDKYWIFGNYVSITGALIDLIPTLGINYSVIEFDFKYCAFRSESRHQTQTKQPCNCVKDVHGLSVEQFYKHADKVFWMSAGQRDKFLERVPSLNIPDHNVVQSSTFDDETLDLLASLAEKNKSSELRDGKVFQILGAGSWIKGVQETAKWCQLNHKNFRAIPNLPYKQFLEELSKGYGFIFMPLDWDTCPRVVIEAKLLGNEEIITNENVLHKNDDWFVRSREEVDAYLRGRGDHFWSTLKTKIE